ncbi:CDP-alcohol phosphatidyltransferase family protein [Teichococcus oryzae]|uniref:CDP-diacylglycerol--glycerol-3-phosphate 3-phosphatidyltransferase n=1 Tax=Teichococcus oryzae TaxID=1608942 RepID=A0A5B2TKW7_9PROT|nr:CDP-alcohol phosphatidyltransferase family protein [Pseudoroseomonas oryzae]KAA2214824.1 CDP-alcohol phosphatidyltransferase family protein [Pseudoroseomonas oryzae]
MLRLIPNAITLARLCAVPATVWLILHDSLDLAFFLFAAAGLSDALDGWLARRWNAQSPLGAMLDPVADKALLVCSYLCLGWRDVLPDWLAILVVFRDVVIVGGVGLLAVLGQPPRMAPSMLSKCNTVAQILLAALALATAGFGLPDAGLLGLLIVVVAVTTTLSGLAYFAQALRRGAAP